MSKSPAHQVFNIPFSLTTLGLGLGLVFALGLGLASPELVFLACLLGGGEGAKSWINIDSDGEEATPTGTLSSITCTGATSHAEDNSARAEEKDGRGVGPSGALSNKVEWRLNRRPQIVPNGMRGYSKSLYVMWRVIALIGTGVEVRTIRTICTICAFNILTSPNHSSVQV